MCENDDILFLSDEDGEDIPFQIIGTLDLDGNSYALLAPLDDDEDDSLLIFRIVNETYEQIEDDALLQRVFDVFRSSDEDYEFCDAE